MTVARRSAGGGILSIMAATAAAAAAVITISHQASAFALISSTAVHRAGTSLRTAREVGADIDLPAAMVEGGDQWVKDSFNGAAAADANGSLNGQKQSLPRLSIDGGQIQGPAEVLVYDTSLRGELYAY